jgi:hypothetical protein
MGPGRTWNELTPENSPLHRPCKCQRQSAPGCVHAPKPAPEAGFESESAAASPGIYEHEQSPGPGFGTKRLLEL